jgi:hypothetical protein
MSLDEILIDFFKKKSDNLGHKTSIKITDDLHIKKIAFDLFKVDNDPYEGLWASQDIDGESFLVRVSSPEYMYNDSGDWTAISDPDRENVTLSYKNTPIIRFSSSEYNFSNDDIMTFKSAVLERASGDSSFVKNVLLEQPDQKRQALLLTFPELSQFLKD